MHPLAGEGLLFPLTAFQSHQNHPGEPQVSVGPARASKSLCGPGDTSALLEKAILVLMGRGWHREPFLPAVATWALSQPCPSFPAPLQLMGFLNESLRDQLHCPTTLPNPSDSFTESEGRTLVFILS